MKQKIVIQVQVNCDKCRSKALKIAAAADGVNSVAIEGKEKDQFVVIGEGVDAAGLTCTLRKKLGYASLETVDEVKEKVENKKGEKEEKKDGKETNPTPSAWIYHQPQFEMYKVVNEPYPSTCTIM